MCAHSDHDNEYNDDDVVVDADDEVEVCLYEFEYVYIYIYVDIWQLLVCLVISTTVGAGRMNLIEALVCCMAFC